MQLPAFSNRPMEVQLYTNADHDASGNYIQEHSAPVALSEAGQELSTESLRNELPIVPVDAITGKEKEQNSFLLPPKELPYLPASQVDIRPQPEHPVVIPFPEASLGKPKGEAVLVLYINTFGEIEKVEIDKSDLPDLFEKTAIDAFMKARMRPAIKDGKLINSKVKVVVEFEDK